MTRNVPLRPKSRAALAPLAEIRLEGAARMRRIGERQDVGRVGRAGTVGEGGMKPRLSG